MGNKISWQVNGKYRFTSTVFFQNVKNKISGVEDMIEEMDTSIKNVKSKNVTDTKHLGNLAHYEKVKPEKNRTRRGRSIPSSESQKIFSSR